MPLRKYGKYALSSHYSSYANRPRYVSSVASKALSLARKNKSLLNVEYKVLDTDISTAVSTTALITNINDIPQGDGVSTRDGRSVKLKSINVHCTLQANASATRGDMVRVMLIQDRSQSGVAPAVTDILRQATVESQRNVTSDQNRFRVYWDKTVVLAPPGEQGDRKYMEYYKSNLNIPMKYDGTGNGAMSTNSFWLLQLGKNSTNTSANIVDARIRFLDN